MASHNTVSELAAPLAAAPPPVLIAEDWHRSALETQRWRERLESETQWRYGRLASAISAMQIRSDEALDGMLAVLTAADPDAYGHAYRVAALSASAARVLGVREPDIRLIARGALLHDVGKLVMPEAILRKPAPLTAEEQAVIRMHPRLGSELVRSVPYLRSASTIVLEAHERPDGLGYPRGLSGDTVSLPARIVGVADAYDTMTRPRVFRDALEPAAALRELDRCSGTQFDRRAAAAIAQLVGSSELRNRAESPQTPAGYLQTLPFAR